MITCTVFPDRGLTRIGGLTPNGVTTVTRVAQGLPDTVLRNGDHFNVTTGGWTLEDSEGPVGVPLTYRADIAVVDRVIQQNLLPTPNFMRGLQGWTGGSGRAVTVETDPTAAHASIAHFGSNGAGYTLAAAPTFVGSVTSAPEVLGPYSLTPPTSGGGAIATNDWVYIVHQQEAAYSTAAAMPSGFTLVGSWTGTTTKMVIWRRKRQGGDVSYTVNQPASASALGTCFWVRGGTDAAPVLSPVTTFVPGTAAAAVVSSVTGINPSLIVKVVGVQMTQPGAKIASAQVTGWDSSVTPYAVGNNPDDRSLLVVAERTDNARDSMPLTAVYSAALTDVIGVQLLIPNATALTGRTVAKGKVTAMAAGQTQPYRLTGRVRFTSVHVWTWDDVLANGSWNKLLTDKATWADVLSTETIATGQVARLYAVVVDPATSTYLTNPVQVLGIEDDRVNTWMDFVVYFNPLTNIPATAEIWFVHGTYSSEYAMEWYMDSIGVTPGSQVAEHDVLWYLDGDTPRPDNSVEAMAPGGGWTTPLDNSVVQWSGTPGNSISVWLSPTQMRATTTCQLNWPQTEAIPCEPVMLSDPVSSALGMWVGLLGIEDLSHASRGGDVDVLNRPDPVATSSTRSWERGKLTVLTTSLTARTRLLSILASGRVILLRNPDPDYPENNWYLALGTADESRVSPDHRFGYRAWELPFTRVARPTGLIEASSETTWEDVAETWTWDQLKASRATWLDVLTQSVGS